MAEHKIDNNITSIVQGALAADTTTITVKSGEGAIFPIPAYLTIEEFNSDNKCIKREIVEAIWKSGDDITVERAVEACIQDDTATTKSISNNALTFNDNAIISLYLTKWIMDELGGWVKVEGDKTDVMVDEDKIIVLDSTDWTYKHLSKSLMCDSCIEEWIKDLTVYNQTNIEDWTTFSISHYDTDTGDLYSIIYIKNADGWTTDDWFGVIMKTDKSGNKVLEKYIDLQVSNDESYSTIFEYNGILYLISYLDNAVIDGTYTDWLLILKFDKDLNIIDNKLITDIIYYRNQYIIEWNIFKTLIRTGSYYAVMDLNLDDLTYTVKESSDYFNTQVKEWWLTKKGSKYYSCYYTWPLYNITDEIIYKKGSNGETYFKWLVKWTNINKLMAFKDDNLFWFDENDTLIFSKTISNIDGQSNSNFEITYIYYDADLDEFKVFLNQSSSKIIYMISFDKDYNYLNYVKITWLLNNWQVRYVEKFDNAYLIYVWVQVTDDKSTEQIIVQDQFVEWTFSDWTCEYKGSTDAITLDDYTQDLTSEALSLTDKTLSDQQLTLSLVDSSLMTYQTCNSTLN